MDRDQVNYYLRKMRSSQVDTLKKSNWTKQAEEFLNMFLYTRKPWSLLKRNKLLTALKG